MKFVDPAWTRDENRVTDTDRVTRDEYGPVVGLLFRFANSCITTTRTDVYNFTLNIVSK